MSSFILTARKYLSDNGHQGGSGAAMAMIGRCVVAACCEREALRGSLHSLTDCSSNRADIQATAIVCSRYLAVDWVTFCAIYATVQQLDLRVQFRRFLFFSFANKSSNQNIRRLAL